MDLDLAGFESAAEKTKEPEYIKYEDAIISSFGVRRIKQWRG